MKGKCHHKEIVILMFHMTNTSLLVCTDQGWSHETQIFTLANSGMQTVAFWKMELFLHWITEGNFQFEIVNCSIFKSFYLLYATSVIVIRWKDISSWYILKWYTLIGFNFCDQPFFFFNLELTQCKRMSHIQNVIY